MSETSWLSEERVRIVVDKEVQSIVCHCGETISLNYECPNTIFYQVNGNGEEVINSILSTWWTCTDSQEVLDNLRETHLPHILAAKR